MESERVRVVRECASGDGDGDGDGTGNGWMDGGVRVGRIIYVRTMKYEV